MKPTNLLSPTETEIAESVARGNSLKEIAAQRFRSIETVKTHVKNICKKLDARGVVDITRIYVLSNPEVFRNLVVAMFISIQSLTVVFALDIDLRRPPMSRGHRMVKVSRGKRKEL